MKMKLCRLILILLSLILLPGGAKSQVIEKNGKYFRESKFHSYKQPTEQFQINKLTSANDSSDLSIIKHDFMINELAGEYGADQSAVSAAIDGHGNYAFAWIDYRNGKKAIYCQFYNSFDEIMGSNIKVNDADIEGNNSPYIASNDNGDFVIVWFKDFYNCMAQQFNNSGEKKGSNILVNTFFGWNSFDPCVGVNVDGTFMVMWGESNFGNDEKIVAKLIDSSGNDISGEITVSENIYTISSYSQGKHIAVDNSGNYFITWSSYAGSNESKIILQQLNSYGILIGNNTIVSSTFSGYNNFFPEITSTDDGYFLIAWEKRRDYPSDNITTARIYNSAGYFVTDEIQVYESEYSWAPVAVSSDRDSTFLIAVGEYSPLAQKIDKNGALIGDTIRVKYNQNDTDYSYLYELTNIFEDHFFASVLTYKKSDADVYLQKFDKEINPLNSFNKISDDLFSSTQKKSIVKYNDYGESIIVWEDQRNGRYDLYAEVFDKDYNPVGNNIQINETISDYWFLYKKEIQSLSDGNFIIAFSGGSSYGDADEVFLQLVNRNGEKVGANVVVQEQNYYSDFNLSLSVNKEDEIFICWYDTYNAYSRIYSKELIPITNQITLLKSTESYRFQPFVISADSNFNILAIWQEYDYLTNTTDGKIKAKFFKANGGLLTSVFIIDSIAADVYYLNCKNDSTDYVLIYQTFDDIYVKRYYSEYPEQQFENRLSYYSYFGFQSNIVEFQNRKLLLTYNIIYDVNALFINDNKRFSNNYLLHTYDYIEPYYEDFNGNNSADLYDNRLFFTYESTTNSNTGYDIWAKVMDASEFNFNQEIFYPPVNFDKLYNNFPNPFNSTTRIVYELLAYHKVKLSIIDILGQEVKVLVDENQEKGLYEVNFDATGLASGVYLLKLEAFNTSIKKMLILK